MELGNMIFGTSRGEKPIPREDAWIDPLVSVMEAAGCDTYGWPKFENETFMVQGYDWDAQCDCGAEDQHDAWGAKHSHAPSCYQIALKSEMAEYDRTSGYAALDAAAFGREPKDVFSGMNVEQESDGPLTFITATPRSDTAMEAWRKASEKRRKFEDRLFKRLCTERDLPYPNGCAVHCDCGRDGRYAAYCDERPHANTCRLIQPNFLFKPTGFRANWYKYPLRDSYMTPPVKLAGWREMMRACAASVSQGMKTP